MTRRPLLHQRWPELSETLRHLSLGDAPTPVRELTGLGLSTRVWLKDESGFGSGGWGGNKVRKLEWLLPEARRRGARTILTVGGIGTNWGLATALYAREMGIHVALGLIDHPEDDEVRAQLRRLQASGATLHRYPTKNRLILAAPWLMARHSHLFGLPYYLPAGGSSPIGALGYVEAALELADQVSQGTLPEPAWIVTAVGSGGTAAGLALGLRLAGLKTRVLGVVVNDSLKLDSATLATLADKAYAVMAARGARLPDVAIGPTDIEVETAWLGEGYAHPTAEGAEAKALAASKEHLNLELTYTAKALAAVIDLDAAGRFGSGPVLFLNTYGPR